MKQTSILFLFFAFSIAFSQSNTSLQFQNINSFLKNKNADQSLIFSIQCEGCVEIDDIKEYVFWQKEDHLNLEVFEKNSHQSKTLKNPKTFLKILNEQKLLSDSEILPIILENFKPLEYNHYDYYLLKFNYKNQSFSKKIIMPVLECDSVNGTRNINYDSNQKSILKKILDEILEEIKLSRNSTRSFQ